MTNPEDKLQTMAERLLNGEAVLHVTLNIEITLDELEAVIGTRPIAQQLSARRYEKEMDRSDVQATFAGTRTKGARVWRLHLP